MSEHCRSCGAEIKWAETPQGKRIPLDKEPVSDGNIVLSSKGQNLPLIALVQSKEEVERLKSQNMQAGIGHVLFKSHFTTCPQSKNWRRK